MILNRSRPKTVYDMNGWIDKQRILCWGTALVVLFFFSPLLYPAWGMESGPLPDSLILNVYLDPAGKVLVTGYADNITGLDFLATSDYRFENDTRQLYALTDGLTAKDGDNWTVKLNARGTYEDYRLTFYLPGDVRLGEINASSGIIYHLSASNDSLVADVQGYDVTGPSVSIQYQRSLTVASAPFPTGLPPGYPGTDASLMLILMGGLILVMGSVLGFVFWRSRSHPPDNPAQAENTLTKAMDPAAVIESQSDTATSDSLDGVAGAAVDGTDAQLEISLPGQGSTPPAVAFADQLAPDEACVLPGEGDPSADRPADDSSPSDPEDEPSAALAVMEPDFRAAATGAKEAIELSREMEAVIQTLTAREQAVIMTLVEHGGRMTQAEIRYETRTPKSSLTGILISLERRKLVTKKEWGRTNIIELSEWFLSQREHS